MKLLSGLSGMLALAGVCQAEILINADFSAAGEFDIAANDAPMGLWITFPETGIFDIGQLKLARFSDADLVDELRTRYPTGGPANLAQATRFPLGLPTGWSVSRESSDGDDVTVKPAAGGAVADSQKSNHAFQRTGGTGLSG